MYEQLTLITNRAKRNVQYALRYGYAIKVTSFVVGNAGHDPDSVITALTPDPSFDPSLDANLDRIPSDAVIAPTLVTAAEDDPYFATVWTCDLAKGTATGIVSSFYLLAQFVYPVTHDEYGKLWVFSVSYSPMQIKTDTESWTIRAGVQY